MLAFVLILLPLVLVHRECDVFSFMECCCFVCSFFGLFVCLFSYAPLSFSCCFVLEVCVLVLLFIVQLLELILKGGMC